MFETKPYNLENPFDPRTIEGLAPKTKIMAKKGNMLYDDYLISQKAQVCEDTALKFLKT